MKTPRFSIILPCTCEMYPGAAKDRENKLIRAINSVLAQTFEDWELIIISDGCGKTIEIYKENYSKYFPKIKCFDIPKQGIFSGFVRQTGIDNAKGKYIIYLDSDDKYGTGHLNIINSNINGQDWVYYDVKALRNGAMIPYGANLNIGNVITACFCHKRKLDITWTGCNGYSHEFKVLEQLKEKCKNYKKLAVSTGYYICHIDKEFDN